MIYRDTSVLLVYTLTESVEVERSKSVRRLFAKVDSGLVSAATSFYALHEVYVFALENAPDLEVGSQFGKAASQKILNARLRILPFVTRTERRRLAGRFSHLKDSTCRTLSALTPPAVRPLLPTTNISEPSLPSFRIEHPPITIDDGRPGTIR